MKWAVYDTEDGIHVVPQDVMGHLLTPGCICQPVESEGVWEHSEVTERSFCFRVQCDIGGLILACFAL